MTSKFKLPRLLPKIGTPPGYKNYLDVLLDQKLQDLSLQSTEFEKRAEAQQAELKLQLKLLGKDRVKTTPLPVETKESKLPEIQKSNILRYNSQDAAKSMKMSLLHLSQSYRALRGHARQMNIRNTKRDRKTMSATLRTLRCYHSNCNLWPDLESYERGLDRERVTGGLEAEKTEIAIMRTPFIKPKQMPKTLKILSKPRRRKKAKLL